MAEMDRVSRIGAVLRNTGFLSSGRAIGDFFLFLLLVVIARSFGPEGAGQYGVAISIAGFFVAFADFGLYPYTVKELSGSASSEDFLSRMISLRLFLTLLAFIVLYLLVPLLGLDSQAEHVTRVVGLQQLIRRLAEGFGAVFIGRERADVAAALEASFKTVGALAAIGVALVSGSLLSAIWLLVGAEVAWALTAGWLVHRRSGGLRMTLDLTLLRETARAAQPYAFSGVLQRLSTRVDVLLLGLLLGTTSAGLYHTAYRIILFSLWVPEFAVLALFPVATRVLAESPQQAREWYRGVVGAVVLVGTPAAVGLIWVAGPVMNLLFGDTFLPAASALRLLAPLILFTWLSQTLAVFLMAANRIAARGRHQAKAVFVNVLGNLLLIPAFGIEGAAAATLLSEMLLLGLLAMELKPILGPPRCKARIVIAGAGSALFSFVLGLLPSLPLAPTVFIGFGLYAATLSLIGEIRSTEGRVLAALLRKG